MKRLCLVIEVAEDRPDLLLAGATVRLADDIGGTVRSAYIEQSMPQSWLGRLFDVQVSHRTELFPTHHDMTGLELARKSA